MRILVDAVPDIEQEHAAFAQDAAHLPEGGRPVGNERDAERAHHRAEGRVRERKRCAVRFLPLDARGIGKLGARIVEHRPGEIGRHQPHRGIEVLAQAAGDDAGAAGDLQHVARRLRRQPPHEVGAERLELSRSHVPVVILGNGTAEVARGEHGHLSLSLSIRIALPK